MGKSLFEEWVNYKLLPIIGQTEENKLSLKKTGYTLQALMGKGLMGIIRIN
jgi:hypothetical protein